MNEPNLIWWIVTAAVVIVVGIVAFLAGVWHRKKSAEELIGSAEQESKRIVSEAMKTAEAKKKEAILEGKDELHRLRNESERELRERRNEVQRQERRAQQKEENLDKKLEGLEKKEEQLISKNKQAEARLAEAEAIRRRRERTDERGESSDRKVQGRVTVSFSLVDPVRHARHLVVPAYQCEGGGEVVVRITVNRAGEVTHASVASGGDDCMRETAVRAARNSVFDINDAAPARHTGTITYIFIPQ